MKAHLIYRRSPLSDVFNHSPNAIIVQSGKRIYLHPFSSGFGLLDTPDRLIWGAYTPKFAAAAAKLNRKFNAYKAEREAFEIDLKATQSDLLIAAKAAPRDTKPTVSTPIEPLSI